MFSVGREIGKALRKESLVEITAFFVKTTGTPLCVKGSDVLS